MPFRTNIDRFLKYVQREQGSSKSLLQCGTTWTPNISLITK